MRHNPKAQQGAVLPISLTILLVITLLGLASVQTSRLQEHMAQNSYDINLAFLAAESSMLDAENMLEGWQTVSENFGLKPDPNQCLSSPRAKDGFYYNAGSGCPTHLTQINWQGTEGFRIAATEVVGVAQAPKYMIEHVTALIAEEDRFQNPGQSTGAADTHVFRITAYGTGRTDHAHVIIQSTYAKLMASDNNQAATGLHSEHLGRLSWKQLDVVE